MIVADTNDDPAVEMNVMNHLLARRVSGLIVSPLEGNTELTGGLATLLDERFPLLFLDRRSNLPATRSTPSAWTRVPPHRAPSGTGAPAHRLRAGNLNSMSAQDRLAGYRKAVAELGWTTTRDWSSPASPTSTSPNSASSRI